MLMRTFLSCLVIALLISAGATAQSKQKELRHVVMFGWKANTPADSVNRVVTAFKALPAQIKLIKRFEWGVNNSPENLNHGLTHCFLLTFASEKDRDDYLVHPAHKAFTQLLPGILDKVTVLDYWAQQ